MKDASLRKAFVLGTFAAIVWPNAAPADPVADFYSGKQMRVIIGFSPGGGYDLYARLVTRHMARFIPGKPTIVPQNMPGAGSAIAAQHMLQQAPRDGTILATISKDSPMDAVVNDVPYKAEFAKLNWLGNPNEDNNIMPVWATTGVQSMEDATKREIVMGTTSASGAGALYMRLLNNVLGTKFKIISGFPGSTELNLAMERGETDGRGSDSWAALKSTKPDWIREKKVNILMQMGFRRSAELADIPLMIDLARAPAERILFETLSSGARIGTPLLTTPDVPAERLEALRIAFDAVMKDPEFLADAGKARLDVNPTPGRDIQDTVSRTINAPADIVAMLRTAIKSDKAFDCTEIAKDKSLCGK